ncbi:LysR family transcriptional regulator [Phyllobacterium sp. SB3]|uniref:LysR family transcriptional regulator n=1 Tax=Phyllobacterium sp. SB3 TaxID=3156073 RepID=UPI0032AFB4E1
MLHITLRQLEYVVAVGKAGSLSTASVRLNVSQPALSVAITHVENCVGELLFLRRKGVAITPTPFGRMFLTDAESLLADAEQLERPGTLSQKRQAHATLGILEELAPSWLAPILVVLRTAFQDTDVRVLSLSFKKLTEALLSGQIDIGLTYDLGLDSTFKRDLLMSVAPCIWVSPEDDLAVRPAVSLAEIADRPLILSDQDLSMQHMLGLFHRIGVTPVVRHRAASIELLRSLAANGEGTGLSYTKPTGTLSYDGKPVARTRISDQAAVEPVVLAYIGAQPTPLPQIRMAIHELAKFPSQPDSSGIETY